MSQEPLFPLKLYIYRDDGTYDEPIEILSEGHLHGVGIKMVLQLNRHRKMLMTDPGDCCVFHMEGGKVIFPPEEKK